MDLFNEKTLYDEIVKVWGENGAHADVYRMLCTRAGVSLTDDENESVEQKVRRIIANTTTKLDAVKMVRQELDGLDLIAAKNLVEMYY